MSHTNNVLIAAGGTGGHIYPGLAIASTLKKRWPRANIIFIGSYVGMEKNIVPRYGYPMEFIRATGFARNSPVAILKATKHLFDSARDSRKLLKKYNPALVIGTGGYTCGVLLQQASMRGYPTLIHEQNAFPGKANRMAAKHADVVCLTFNEAAKYFPEGKTVLCGNPVRDAFKDVNRAAMREKLGISPDKRILLATGGSQGARSINTAMVDVIEHFKDNPNVVIYHLSGKKNYDTIVGQLKERGIDADQEDNLHVIAYSNDMDTLMGASDLVISRAGATTIAEISASGTPSILIPFPYATGDHQRFNAQAVEDAGAGIMIEDKDLTGQVLCDAVDKIFWDDKKLAEMKVCAKNYAKIDADEKIVDEAMRLIRR